MITKVQTYIKNKRAIINDAQRYIKEESRLYLAYYTNKFEYDLFLQEDCNGTPISSGLFTITDLDNQQHTIIIREESVHCAEDIIAYIHPAEIIDPNNTLVHGLISIEAEKQFRNIIDYLIEGDIHKSPYSPSFYSKKVDFSNKPDGLIRVSNHWNVVDRRDGQRNRADINTGNKWSIGVYNAHTKLYEIIFIDHGKDATEGFKIQNNKLVFF